jgi:hypothetical protein
MVNSESPPSRFANALLEHTAVLALGGLLSTAAFVAVLHLLDPLASLWLDGALALLFYMLLFFATLTYMERYDTADWTVPAGVEDSNWALRRRVSIALGVLAVAVTAVAATIWIKDTTARGLMLAQSVIMAVSGANDFRRFRLPLPLTIVGLGIAVMLLAIGPYSGMIIALAIGWSALLMLIHRFVARTNISLGDQIAIFWIALAAPFNGLLAIFAGQLVLDILARITDWKARKKRVPVGGAWLVATALLLAVPQWPALLATATASAPAAADVVDPGVASRDALFRSGRVTRGGLNELRQIAHEASYLTGRLSFVSSRGERIAQARRASERVRELRRMALLAEAPATARMPLARTLSELSQALAVYDVDAVRAVSGDLSDRRAALDQLLEDFKQWQESELSQGNALFGVASQTTEERVAVTPADAPQAVGAP